MAVSDGASTSGVQLTSPPSNGSLTTTSVRVTSPVLVTVKVYSISTPTSYGPALVTCLSSSMPGFWATGVVTSSSPGTLLPEGSSASTVATLITSPASTSSWVTV